jgi:hypothetical protein
VRRENHYSDESTGSDREEEVDMPLQPRRLPVQQPPLILARGRRAQLLASSQATGENGTEGASEDLMEFRDRLIDVLQDNGGQLKIGALSTLDSEIVHAAERWARSAGKSTKRGMLARAIEACNAAGHFWCNVQKGETNPCVGLALPRLQ